jgi:hypothetical protein
LVDFHFFSVFLLGRFLLAVFLLDRFLLPTSLTGSVLRFDFRLFFLLGPFSLFRLGRCLLHGFFTWPIFNFPTWSIFTFRFLTWPVFTSRFCFVFLLDRFLLSTFLTGYWVGVDFCGIRNRLPLPLTQGVQGVKACILHHELLKNMTTLYLIFDLPPSVLRLLRLSSLALLARRGGGAALLQIVTATAACHAASSSVSLGPCFWCCLPVTAFPATSQFYHARSAPDSEFGLT